MSEVEAGVSGVLGDGDEIVIADRFRGPPRSGNGGYVAGVGAALLNTDNPVEVTLRAPIPLDRRMQVRRSGNTATVIDGETLILEIQEAVLDLEVPGLPAWEEVRTARERSPSFLKRESPLATLGVGFHPICFCCGAGHDEGLQVFAAPVAGGDQVAAVWPTKGEWADEEGHIPETFLWAALDCPGQFAFMAGNIVTGMMGRMTGQLFAPAPAGEEYLVTGWRIGVEGRKHFAGTAIHNREGQLIGKAMAVWIGRRDAVPGGAG